MLFSSTSTRVQLLEVFQLLQARNWGTTLVFNVCMRVHMHMRVCATYLGVCVIVFTRTRAILRTCMFGYVRVCLSVWGNWLQPA